MKRQLTICALAFVLLCALDSAAGEPKSKWAKYDGARLHYLNAGEGDRALVFIHGWTCSADFWKKSLQAFPEHRVIAVDLPGHGRSDKPKTDYTMDYFAGAVRAVLEETGVKKAVLVGHSMGTPVMRQFYRHHPEMVEGLVIVDGALFSAPKEEMEAFIAPLRENFRENSVKFIDGMLQPVTDKKLRREIRAVMTAVPEHVALSAMEGMIDEKIWTADRIEVPVLAILARSDWWKPDVEERYREIAPDLTFRMWNGVSHFLMMERPAGFNAEIRKFVAAEELLRPAPARTGKSG